MKICMYHVSTACCNQFASATDVYIHIYIYVFIVIRMFCDMRAVLGRYHR